MSTSIHLAQQQERDLREIRTQLRAMADNVTQAVDDAITSLERRDRRLAYSVILGDNRIDAAQHALDHLSQVFMVRHMPAGSVLRFVVAAIKVAGELERIGDYAEAVAHRAVTLARAQNLPQLDSILKMGRAAIDLVEASVESFLEADVAKANKVIDDEDAIDEMNRDIFDALSGDQADVPLTLRFALLGVLNRLERVADRASNIAEGAIYATKGEIVPHGPRGGHKVLFLSTQDAALGPMVEAMANANAPLAVAFTSCGLDPATTFNPIMLEVLASRGLSCGRSRPRGLDEVGPLEGYSVVVLLSHEAEAACPPLPYRTVALSWDLPDPAPGQPVDRIRLEAALADAESRLVDLLSVLIPSAPPDRKEPR